MIEDLKVLLGITETDATIERKLELLLLSTQKRLQALLGGQESPEDLDYIVLDVTVARYNRIGSEGLSSHTVEGESQSFTEDDFAPYREDIQAWLNRQADAKKGRVRFL